MERLIPRVMKSLFLLLVIATSSAVAEEITSQLRTWTSSTGSKVEAKLISLTHNQATLKTVTGNTAKVPLSNLSNPDLVFLINLTLKAKSSPQGPEPAKVGVPKGKIIKVSAEDLSGAYDDNVIAANQRYKDKVVEVIGTIREISADRISLEPASGAFFGWSVQVTLIDMKKAIALKKGQRIRFRGNCRPRDGFDWVYIANAVIVK
ncbi:MAG: hypothetical protein CMP28_14215 [Roseibacillus sp.]|nr:hypothetical protein [Roseibacillus sp.]